MAPLTRSRAIGGGRVPNALMAEYYVQRASAGLILSEATSVTPHGRGLCRHAGHLVGRAGRRLEAGHRGRARGGRRIFLQLWHVGRISDPCS
jgi:2,4-dienoyl-CoA reductase-like NADH-dependent reductase (Old Yellow Enzyme family)